MTIRILLAAAAAMLAACSPATEAKGDPEPAAADYATVDAPIANARVTSPLSVSGTAPSAWYEGEQFDAILMGEDGTVYAQSPAIAGASEGAGSSFTAQFAFTVSADTPANVILQQQVIGEDQDQPLKVEVPVVLTPTG